MGDIGGGALYLVIGMLTILRARDTGQGCVVDAIVDGGDEPVDVLAIQQQPERGTRSKPAGWPHWSRCYACAMGPYVGAMSGAEVLCAISKHSGLQDTEAFGQYNPKLGQISRALAAIFAAKPQSHYRMELFEDQMPVSPRLFPMAGAK